MKNFYLESGQGNFVVDEHELLNDAGVREDSELAEWVRTCKPAEVWEEQTFSLECVGEITIQ